MKQINQLNHENELSLTLLNLKKKIIGNKFNEAVGEKIDKHWDNNSLSIVLTYFSI